MNAERESEWWAENAEWINIPYRKADRFYTAHVSPLLWFAGLALLAVAILKALVWGQ